MIIDKSLATIKGMSELSSLKDTCVEDFIKQDGKYQISVSTTESERLVKLSWKSFWINDSFSLTDTNPPKHAKDKFKSAYSLIYALVI